MQWALEEHEIAGLRERSAEGEAGVVVPSEEPAGDHGAGRVALSNC